MFTTTIGRTFLREYNRRKGKEFSAKDFFDQEFFPLFFDHPKKYLMWVQNAPFTQGVSSKDGFLGVRSSVKDQNGDTKVFSDKDSLNEIIKKIASDVNTLDYKIKKKANKNEWSIELLEKLTSTIRHQKLLELHDKIIIDGDRDMSVALGFPASEVKEFATTSGSITDLELTPNEDDVYLSWIGGALNIGVSGALSLLFDDPTITYAAFEGWKKYRYFLNDQSLEKLRPNQVSTWNGQWLTYYFGDDYIEDFDFAYLEQLGVFSQSNDKIEVNTVPWSRLFFSLSRKFKDKVMTGYVSNFGQTNKSIGFFPFYFKSGGRLVEVYQKLFGEDQYEINKREFENLFGKHIKRACELGSVGLQALEPANLSKYFANESNLNLKPPNLKSKPNEAEEEYQARKLRLEKKEHDNLLYYQTYKTWLMAMITKNKEEISDYTQEIAEALVQYRKGARGTERKNLLEKKLFAGKRKTDFMAALIEIISDQDVEDHIIEKMKSLRDRVHFMPNEDFVYFSLLLKFDYAYEERISNQ